ncbi:hypothetical protein WN943_021211 [Citrus x changshan-huyou]
MLPFHAWPKSKQVVHKKGFAVGITLASVILVIFVIIAAILVLRRIKNGDDILEDWEVEYGARRFRYSELYSATKGFREKNLVGSGGFGKVYRGVSPSTGLEVAIKRVAHNSRQGMKEFVAEITSMGRLRHRNLAQLHGCCRKQDELLLVYDYVPNEKGEFSEDDSDPSSCRMTSSTSFTSFDKKESGSSQITRLLLIIVVIKLRITIERMKRKLKVGSMQTHGSVECSGESELL